jgi:hypothetical protein
MCFIPEKYKDGQGIHLNGFSSIGTMHNERPN